MSNISIQELAALTGAEIVLGTGPQPEVITGFADLMTATASDLSFFGNAKYLPQVRKSQAGAVLVPREFEEATSGVKLVVENPSMAFAVAVDQLSPKETTFEPGIDPSASVHPTAKVDGDKVRVGAGAVIGEGVEIGEGSDIGQGVSLDRGVSLGKDCRLHANASVREHCVLGDRVIVQPGAVIGSDGFGFEMVNGRHEKIEQRGIVQIDDDVGDRRGGDDRSCAIWEDVDSGRNEGRQFGANWA